MVQLKVAEEPRARDVGEQWYRDSGIAASDSAALRSADRSTDDGAEPIFASSARASVAIRGTNAGSLTYVRAWRATRWSSIVGGSRLEVEPQPDTSAAVRIAAPTAVHGAVVTCRIIAQVRRALDPVFRSA